MQVHMLCLLFLGGCKKKINKTLLETKNIDLTWYFVNMFRKLTLTLIQWTVKLSLSLLSTYSFLATTSADTTVNLWQTADFSLKKTLKEANQRWVWDCAFSEDSQYLITGLICMCLNTW